MEGPTHPPNLLFRAATLIGCVALLLGVAGVFYFGGREATERRVLPDDAATVLLRGIEADANLRVEVRWVTGGVEASETGARGREAGLWHFREAPEGVPLTLRVYRIEAEGRRPVHEQYAIFTRGAGFEVYVRAD